jgi:hypothetical protein
MLPPACSFIVDGLTFSCRCSTLHVSAYMAIFRCVWCFTFIFLKESASLLLLPLLHVIILCSFSFFLWYRLDVLVHFMTLQQSSVFVQLVTLWLSTAAALVGSYGICGGQSGAGPVSLRVLRFLLTVIPPTATPSYHPSPSAGTIRQIMTDGPIGLDLSPLLE